MSILKLEGAHENELATIGEFNPNAPHTALMLPTGQRIVLPTEMLLQGADRNTTELSTPERGSGAEETASVSATPSLEPSKGSADGVISLVAEELLVGKAQRETGRVRLRRDTEEHTQTVSVPLTEVRWEVQHMPIDQVVDTPPEFRQVGDTAIFPMVEERLVVKRELWLREEVHVRRVEVTVEKQADFVVKRDVLVETRSGPGSDKLAIENPS